jgi:hypothetical protein
MMSKFILSMQTLAQQSRAVLACAVAVCSFAACSDSEDGDNEEPANTSDMTFFVTSTTHDGNLGGLDGADAICDELATAVGSGNRTWRAYLSAENGGDAINARDRIGNGPWENSDGDLLAEDLDALHDPALVGDQELFIDENRVRINGQWNGSNGMDGNPPNEHDIMTGSDSNGMLLMVADTTTTCEDWTSNSMMPGPQVGHSDGMGPGMDTSMARFTSWNGGHASRGCSSELLSMSGSTGRIYCFAAD